MFPLIPQHRINDSLLTLVRPVSALGRGRGSSLLKTLLNMVYSLPPFSSLLHSPQVRAKHALKTTSKASDCSSPSEYSERGLTPHPTNRGSCTASTQRNTRRTLSSRELESTRISGSQVAMSMCTVLLLSLLFVLQGA